MALSVSLFVSGGTDNQVVAFLMGAIVLFILNVLGTDVINSVVPEVLDRAFTTLSPVNQLSSFIKGVLDVRSIFYFASVTSIMLFLTIMDVEKRS
jgi:tetrahydromethanopterin S-methyltransferase subunit C